MFQEKLVLFPPHPLGRMAARGAGAHSPGLVEVSKGMRHFGLSPWGSLQGLVAFRGGLNFYPNWDKTSFQY